MKIIFVSYLQIVIGHVSNVLLLLQIEEDFPIPTPFFKINPFTTTFFNRHFSQRDQYVTKYLFCDI
jgi:hypothetical protein